MLIRRCLWNKLSVFQPAYLFSLSKVSKLHFYSNLHDFLGCLSRYTSILKKSKSTSFFSHHYATAFLIGDVRILDWGVQDYQSCIFVSPTYYLIAEISSSSIIEHSKLIKICYYCSRYWRFSHSSPKIKGFTNPFPEIKGFGLTHQTLLTPPLAFDQMITLHMDKIFWKYALMMHGLLDIDFESWSVRFFHTICHYFSNCSKRCLLKPCLEKYRRNYKILEETKLESILHFHFLLFL